MNKIVRKVFYPWQMDKEKKFLEAMALEGFRLTRVSFCKFEFEEIKPKKLVYQFDFRMLSKKKEKEYLSYFENWEYIDRYGGWYFFFVDAEEKGVDYSIFNDNKSLSEVYKRILIFLAIAGFPMYYNVFFFLPNTDLTNSSFPKFYSFFKIVTIILTILHMFVVLKLLVLYKKLKDSIVE